VITAMRHLILSFLTCATLICAERVYEAAPATIVIGEQTIANAYVFEENLDGVSFAIEDPRGPVTKRPRKQYDHVEYGDPKDGNFKVAEIQFERGDNDKALATYRKASESATYQWVQEKSVIRAAELSLRLGKPEDGIALLDKFVSENAKSARLAEAVGLRADLRLAKGDLAGADKDFALLASNVKAWHGIPNRGVLGRTEVLRRSKKFPEAVQLLQPVFASIQPSADPEDWAAMGVTLADLQMSAGQKEAALATARVIAFTTLTPAHLRCAAHLRLAQIMADGATGRTLLNAFDHAVLALRDDTDQTTVKAAKALAREVVGRINKDAAFAEPERKEYRTYALNL